MQQQSEGKAEGVRVADGPREVRKRGRLFGRWDPKTLRFSMRRGDVEFVIDMRQSVRTRRLTEVGK